MESQCIALAMQSHHQHSITLSYELSHLHVCFVKSLHNLTHISNKNGRSDLNPLYKHQNSRSNLTTQGMIIPTSMGHPRDCQIRNIEVEILMIIERRQTTQVKNEEHVEQNKDSTHMIELRPNKWFWQQKSRSKGKLLSEF